MRIPDTLYAMAGDAAIAYQVYGSGEHRVVGVPATLSNVELWWEWSPFHHLFERWGSFATVVAFDKRGSGCSERVEVPATLEQQMEDFNVVMDAVGWERATIHAHSEGGAVACLFAAIYPERTERLILQGCFARGITAPGYEIGVDRGGSGPRLGHAPDQDSFPPGAISGGRRSVPAVGDALRAAVSDAPGLARHSGLER
jgi:pimeloyl-ACP methyl ester carboxylesterase